MSTKILRIQTLCQPNRRHQWCSWPKNRCNLKPASLRTKCVKQRWWYPQFWDRRLEGIKTMVHKTNMVVTTCKASLLFFGFPQNSGVILSPGVDQPKKLGHPTLQRVGKFVWITAWKKQNFSQVPQNGTFQQRPMETETPSASGRLYLCSLHPTLSLCSSSSAEWDQHYWNRGPWNKIFQLPQLVRTWSLLDLI